MARLMASAGDKRWSWQFGDAGNSDSLGDLLLFESYSIFIKQGV